MYSALPAETLLDHGKYKILDVLGQGGFGITYKASHAALGGLVAIKEFYPQEYAQRQHATGQIVPITTAESYDRSLQRFIREGRLLENISHPNIVRVRDLFEERGTAYLVMELIQGNTLRHELETQPGHRLQPAQISAIMESLVSALSTVHRDRIYHLDIKPENILITQDRQVKLIDFGAARQGFSSKTTRSYSPAYAAPEVIAGNDIGAASDIFELAMVMYEMLIGELPPTATQRLMSAAVKGQDLLDFSTFPQPWQRLLTDGLQLKIEQRSQSVAQWWSLGQQSWQQTPQPQPQFQQEPTQISNSPSGDVTIPAHRAAYTQPPRDFNQDLNRDINRNDSPEQLRQRQEEEGRKTRKTVTTVLLACGGLFALLIGLAVLGNLLPDSAATDQASTPPSPQPSSPPLRPTGGGSLSGSGSSGSGSSGSGSSGSTASPVSAEDFYKRANEKQERGNLQAAIADFDQAIKLRPNYSEAFNSRGNARYSLGDRQGAISDYDEALRLNNPEPWIVYTNRGNVRSDLKDNQGALADYNQAIKLKSDYSSAYNGRGIIRARLNDRQAAIADYDQALKLNNTEPWLVYNNRGISRNALGDKQGALADYNQAIKLKPDYTSAYNGRGNIRSDLGDKQGAIADYTQAIKLDPENATAYYNRGLRHQEAGNKASAREDFQRSADLYRNKGENQDYQDALARLREL
jgi:serine/threonine protein kinase